MGGNMLHILALNSEIEPGGRQREWLEKDLQDHQGFLIRIAGYHRPFRPHCAREPENDYEMKQWSGLFYQYRLNIAFDADAHVCAITYPLRPDSSGYMGFSRDDRHGTLFVGEGGWGAYPRKNDDDKPWTLVSGSYNQFKWIHVLQEKGGEKITMKIHVVISGTYDENGHQTLYDKEVEPLTENNLFKIPENINLQKFPDGKYFVTYPGE